mgnify:CR=1 FL=1
MKFKLALTLAVSILLSFNQTLHAGEIIIKNGEKMAFLGDSITAQGWNSSTGYVRLVLAGLKEQGINITPIPVGAGGHQSIMMLRRLDKDVLQKKPHWMTLSCGVNDVWHGARGVKLEDYKKNIIEIVDKCQAAGVKVIIFTPTMIGETDHPHFIALNKKLDTYVAFLKTLAKERNLLIADLNADMKAVVQKHQKNNGSKHNYLTNDGVHMNPLGNVMMAKGVLRSFGFDDVMIAKSATAWDKLSVAETVRLDITLEQYKKYSQLSNQKKRELRNTMKDLIVEAVK